METQTFSAANLKRCEDPKGFNQQLYSWGLSDWMMALVGEIGEAANVVKKLNRIRDGIPGNKESTGDLIQALQEELADTYIYLDLFIQAAGFNLEEIVKAKWNKTSDKIGYGPRLI